MELNYSKVAVFSNLTSCCEIQWGNRADDNKFIAFFGIGDFMILSSEENTMWNVCSNFI
jgi:hypothetical protein